MCTEHFLFSDSIKNNIKFSMLMHLMKEVKKTTSISCCNEFIEDLENGYDMNCEEDLDFQADKNKGFHCKSSFKKSSNINTR